ncbi:MAG: chemotaxis protein CheA [Gammaproteobacteria bacterium]|nr:chemotaxis protein CheA [Gammaproteobacteria bacterium]
MTSYVDDEILEDFLIETSEILERLGDELLGFEKDPENSEILNSIFRGFHTIKGGAGFLGFSSLVNSCHKLEDIFNLLRQSQIKIDSGLMDLILQGSDYVNVIISALREGNEEPSQDDELIHKLNEYLLSCHEAGDQLVEKAMVDVEVAGEAFSDSDDAELEAMITASLSRREKKSSGLASVMESTEKSVISSDSLAETITEEEFEQLLDTLNAKKEDKQASTDMTEAPPQVTKVEKSQSAALAVTRKEKKPSTVKKADTTVRVDTRRLDDIMNLVGELVLSRNRLTALRDNFNDKKVIQAISNLDIVTADLQSAVMKTRMQPIKKVFGRFPRMIRDLSRSLNKEVDLVLLGEETDLDKNLVEELSDPLIHLIRNSVDHGIETPAEREKKGKHRVGKVVLSAEQEGDHILLKITDDGKGLDVEQLKIKALKKGIISDEKASTMTDSECFELIFMPGFSTKESVSDVSGRGVGMDVVKTRIAKLNGSIEIESTLAKGTNIVVKLPLTLAILPTLMVVVNGRKYALPLSIVNEIFELNTKKRSVVGGKDVILNRGKAPPLFFLKTWLSFDYMMIGREAKDEQVIMIQAGNQSIGFVVDQVIGQEEVVIKPLGVFLNGVTGLAGATITGDGNVALILDIPTMLRSRNYH